jgi:hypothetical protein
LFFTYKLPFAQAALVVQTPYTYPYDVKISR